MRHGMQSFANRGMRIKPTVTLMIALLAGSRVSAATAGANNSVAAAAKLTDVRDLVSVKKERATTWERLRWAPIHCTEPKRSGTRQTG